MPDLKEKILNEYSKLGEDVFLENKKISETRKDALDYFTTFGFPNKKMEDWRFTNLKQIINNDFEFTKEKPKKVVLKNFLIPKLKANILVYINGEYSEENSKIISENKNLYIGNLKNAYKTEKDFVEKYFAKYANYKADGFTALNTSLATDGAYIHIPENCEIKEPVFILNILDSVKSKVIGQPRNLVIAEKSSEVHIIEEYYTIGENDSFSNVVTEIYADENSNIQYYKIQNEELNSYHIGTTQVFQERDSVFNSVTISWGGSVIRNNLNSYLNGENIECNYKGLYYITGKQHIDNHTLVDHATPNCNSNEFYKGIIDDEADAVFNGKIMVRKDAQKTNAYQMNRNILLSNNAVINSKPQLEIYADDVKCSHGATTGQIDNEQLFYLKARGIGEKEGKKLLLYAFANEIIEDIEIEELKIYLEEKLSKKLES
jgi:Fe-S cluster assembly protein SufD